MTKEHCNSECNARVPLLVKFEAKLPAAGRIFWHSASLKKRNLFEGGKCR